MPDKHTQIGDDPEEAGQEAGGGRTKSTQKQSRAAVNGE